MAVFLGQGYCYHVGKEHSYCEDQRKGHGSAHLTLAARLFIVASADALAESKDSRSQSKVTLEMA